MNNHWIKRLKSVFAIAAMLGLAACGGGGSGNSANLTTPQTNTASATMQAGTVVVGSTEVGTSVAVSSDSAGQQVLTIENAGSNLANAQAGQVMVFEASTAMPFGFAGIVQSVQTTNVNGIPTTTASFLPADIGSVFQNLNLDLSNVAADPQLMAGVALQNGARAYTRSEPKVASGMLGAIQSGLIELNLLSTNNNTAVGVDFSHSGTGGIHAALWKVNGKWVDVDPQLPQTSKVDLLITGQMELQNPVFSKVNLVIENGKLVTHNLQLQGTLKRNIKATVTGNFQATAADLSTLFASPFDRKNSSYNEIGFNYKGAKVKVKGVAKDPSKIILGAAILSVNGVIPTAGNSATGNMLKKVPIGLIVTFFMTADMQVEATASLGYQWRDSDLDAGVGFSYDDSLGLPVSLLTGNTKPPVPFWNETAHLDQQEGVSTDVSGSAKVTLTAGVDGGFVLTGLEIAQTTIEGGIRADIAGQFSQPVGGTPSGCHSNIAVTAGVRSVLDVAAGVELKTDIQNKWLKWLDTSISAGYVYEFPIYPAAGVDWLGEMTIWEAGADTCHIPLFTAAAGTTLHSYSFDASSTGYQPMVSSYAWNFGDGATASGVTATHTYSAPGDYTATLTVTFSDGVQKTVNKTIAVAAVPPLTPVFIVIVNDLQADFDASISTPSADITSYSWSFGDGATASGATTTHTYAASDTPWSTTLSITDRYGRTASTSQNISITCPYGQTLVNGQCITQPVTPNIIAVTPTTATIGQVTTFTVAGTNLTSGMGFAVADCSPSNNELAGGTTTRRQFSCTPGLTGVKAGVVKDIPGGTVLNNFSVNVSTSPTFSLNDTGITASQCYEAGSNVLVACNSAGALALNNAQDGMLGRDVNAADNTDGKLGFSFTAVSGGCVQDNVTGLMWEVKTADGGLRDGTKTYTNYDSTTSAQKWDGLTYINPTQADIEAATNTVGYVTAVNASNLCGQNDWRLPTADELQSIIDYGTSVPAIDSTWFPDPYASGYWSASPRLWTYSSGVDPAAWIVSFYVGTLNGGNRYDGFHVRLVRAGQ